MPVEQPEEEDEEEEPIEQEEDFQCVVYFWQVSFLLDSAYQAPVVQTLDSAIQWINHHPTDKYWGN